MREAISAYYKVVRYSFWYHGGDVGFSNSLSDHLPPPSRRDCFCCAIDFFAFPSLISVASNGCEDVSIRNNHIHDNGNENRNIGHGILLTQGCDYSTIEGNDVHDNMLPGIVLRETSNCQVLYNNVSNTEGEREVYHIGVFILRLTGSPRWPSGSLFK